MKFGSRRTIYVAVATVIVASMLSVAFASAQAAGAAGRPQMSEQAFKNVVVLKGIPVDEFMDTMGMFAAALSMNCTDCHTQDSSSSWEKFAEDTPLKQMARRMTLMVQAINKNNFAGTRSITCYTCHRGDQKPQTIPSLTVQYSPPVEEPNAYDIISDPTAPAATAVWDKYIQAIGGAQKVNALTSIVAKGTYEGYDTDHAKVPVDLWAKAPTQRSQTVHALFGDSVRVFDGTNGWIAAPDKPIPLMPLTGDNLQGAKVDGMLLFPGQLRAAYTQWKVGLTTIDDKDVRVLQGRSQGKQPVNFYFDPDNGLMTRVVRFNDTLVGIVPLQIDFSDYKDVNGVKMPHKIITTWTDGQTTTVITQYTANAPVDAAKFNRPAPAQPPKLQ